MCVCMLLPKCLSTLKTLEISEDSRFSNSTIAHIFFIVKGNKM